MYSDLVLTHATGVYSKTSPDRSSLLIDLPSPASFSKGQDDFVQNSSTSGQSGFVQDTSTSLVPRIPRHSCPDITVYHNDCDVVTKDKVYRDMKMREFESLIDNSKDNQDVAHAGLRVSVNFEPNSREFIYPLWLSAFFNLQNRRS